VQLRLEKNYVSGAKVPQGTGALHFLIRGLHGILPAAEHWGALLVRLTTRRPLLTRDRRYYPNELSPAARV
jgi:hypothetical protein